MTATDWILLSGMTLVCVSLLTMALSRRKSGGPQELDADERRERSRQRLEMTGDLESASEEIEKLAGRLNRQIDTQADRLEDLLRRADERIAELRRLAGEPAPRRANDGPDLFTAAAAPAPPAEPASDPLSEKIYRLADTGTPPIQIARELNEHVGKIELILALRNA